MVRVQTVVGDTAVRWARAEACQGSSRYRIDYHKSPRPTRPRE
jgi:hypothetical protein